MHTLLPILAMLALVAGSGLLARAVPRIPLPLLQIAIGALAGWPPGGLHVSFHPQIFMLLFIPPMLFADGWQMPQREFGAYKWPILLSSTLLVLFTVGALGWLIHVLLPGLPTAEAFLLAAVLSPTDAVAVSAILQRHPVPTKLRHLIEGEALMNDAAALVAVKFAVAAVLTRSFSLPQALADFVWVACGGVAVGIGFAWCFKLLHDRLLFWREERAAAPTVLLLLLVPFAPYLIAEHLGLSGVLAAVTAGMTTSAFDARSSRFNAFHLQTQNVWSVILFVFNGLIFTLVGLQVPQLVQHLPLPHPDLPTAAHMGFALFSTALLIALGVLAVRFAGLAGGGWLARGFGKRRATGARAELPLLAWSGIATLGGTRGGITLAAVLGVPLLMPDGSDFPARELLVFQATMVIVLSLLIASVGLPWLLRRLALRTGSPHGREAAWARDRAARAALRTLESADTAPHGATPPDPMHALVRARIDHSYRHRLRPHQPDHPDHPGESAAQVQQALALERHLRLDALQAERDELHRLRLAHRINDETLRALIHEIDLVEMVIRSRPGG
ncbi:MAG: Na+/H+ antiporter [Pseudomonadota bacterium]